MTNSAVMPTHAKRIPSLDGLRAISIAAVLMGHLAGTRGFPAAVTAAVRNSYVDVANLGVRVFFVISGFLITGLLLAELRATGSISLPRFYLRRTRRIVPAYVALLLVVALLDAAGVLELPTRDLVHAVTYTMNYAPDRHWTLGHLWSLSVEEQFYLLWPAAVYLGGISGARHVAVSVLWLVPIIRVAEATIWPARTGMIGETFETAADALAIGCCLALSRDALFNLRWYRRAVSSRWFVPALLLVGLAIMTRFRPGILLGSSLVNVAIMIGIDRCVRFPEGIVGRWLNARPLVFVGTLSYSLYLWQQLFLNRGSHATLAAFPLNLVAAIACALGSYYLIERPALRGFGRRVPAFRPRTEAVT